MELQAGEEAKATVVQPAAPQIVFDTTKKEKKPISEKHRAQLEVARQARIAKRKAEKEAIAKETAAAKADNVTANPTVPVAAAPAGEGEGGGGGTAKTHKDSPATTATTTTPTTNDDGTGGGAASTLTGEGTGHEMPPPSKRQRHHSTSTADGGTTYGDTSGGATSGAGSAEMKVSETQNNKQAGIDDIRDPIIRDIRMGKKKPLLWSCEGLDALREYKPPCKASSSSSSS